jgi:hypothetical protein
MTRLWIATILALLPPVLAAQRPDPLSGSRIRIVSRKFVDYHGAAELQTDYVPATLIGVRGDSADVGFSPPVPSPYASLAPSGRTTVPLRNVELFVGKKTFGVERGALLGTLLGAVGGAAFGYLSCHPNAKPSVLVHSDAPSPSQCAGLGGMFGVAAGAPIGGVLGATIYIDDWAPLTKRP